MRIAARRIGFHVLILCCLTSLVEAQEPCGTDVIHRNLMSIDADYQKKHRTKEKKMSEYLRGGGKRTSSTIDTIPVVVHVLHTGQTVGTGYNISDAQVQSSIDRVNEAFADYDGSGTDANIRFALAVRDPATCAASTGINRIDATGVEDYENVGISTSTDRVNLFDLSRWNTEEYLNFWIVSEIDDNNGNSGTQGYATFSNTSHRYDGVVCMYNTTGYDPDGSLGYELKSGRNQNETVIHEFGHYLDVYHTFQGDDTNGDGSADSCPSDADCGTHGDCCGDTDAHQRTGSNVCWTGVANSCTGSTYGNVVKNYMAYSSQDCKDRFTSDQVARMQAALATSRPGLLTSPGLTTIAATEPAADCSPATSSTGTGTNYGVGFVKITLGDWTSESGNTYEDGGYQDNWCNQFNLDLNTTYNYDITLSGNNAEYVRAWMDYDNDGSFSNASELIISSGSKVTSLSGSFTTPSSATTNTSLRIRFRASQSSSTDACLSPTYSQAEDYSVYFANSAVLTASETTLSDINTVTCCASTAQSFTLTGSDLLNDVDVSLANSDFELSSDGSNYSSALTLSASGGNIQSQPITLYVRLKSGLTEGSYADNLTISSSPATDLTIPLSGQVGESDGVRGNAFYIATASTANYAIADDFKGITGGDSRTYEFWLKTSNDESVMLANGTNSSGKKWIIRVNSGFLRVETNDANKIGSTTISDNEWHHIAVVLDNSLGANLNGLSLYVDGVLETISSSSGTSNTVDTDDSQNLWIGLDHHDRSFSGYLDEIKVWSLARTEEQIRESMHLTLVGNETGLEAYYQFNETSGTTISDPVNGHGLSLVGSGSFAGSTVDVGSGSFGMLTLGSTGGSGVEVVSNNLEIDFSDGGTAPDGDLYIYQIEDKPANGTGENYEGRHHWVVRNFGNNQTGLAIESVQMTLPLTDPILNYEPASMSLHKRASNSDGSWTEVANQATTVTGGSGIIDFETLTGFDAFSQLVVASSGVTLPVEFLAFKAVRSNPLMVLLNWSTASETDNSGFAILRSYDGEEFERIDFVAGQGSTTSTSQYQLAVKERKSAYYRLRQIDLDGTETLSAIRFVAGEDQLPRFSVFPNPTKGAIQLLSESDPNEILECTLYNLDGRVLLRITGDLPAINLLLNEELLNQPSGVYLLNMNDGIHQHTERLIIKRE